MPLAPTLRQEPCQIPADCFNRVRVLQKRHTGPIDFPLPGLSDNRMVVNGIQWQCWNRPLNTLLLSWHDFRVAARSDLSDPVACTLSVHHSYSRTIIHRIYDSVESFCADSFEIPHEFTFLRLR